MTNMSIQPLWLTHFIEILLVLEFQHTKFIVGAFSYKAHFRPQISSNVLSTYTFTYDAVNELFVYSLCLYVLKPISWILKSCIVIIFVKYCPYACIIWCFHIFVSLYLFLYS